MAIIKVEKRVKTLNGYEDIIYQKTSADLVVTNDGSNVEAELSKKAPMAHTHPTATTEASGLMSSTDKSKLDGIAEGANNYVHPTAHNASMITESTTKRFVSDTEKATWNAKASTSVATQSANGLMASADKIKLDGIATGANNYVHPNNASTRHVTDTQIANWDAKETTTGSQAKADKALTDAKSYTDTKVASLVSSAPETLDTLQELADALGNDPNFATTVATQIGGKVDKVDGKGLSTNDYTTAEKNKLAGLSNYSLPTASSTTLGGVKIGSGINISSGVISVTHPATPTWNTLTGKPSVFPPSAHTHVSMSASQPTNGEETWYKIL